LTKATTQTSLQVPVQYTTLQIFLQYLFTNLLPARTLDDQTVGELLSLAKEYSYEPLLEGTLYNIDSKQLVAMKFPNANTNPQDPLHIALVSSYLKQYINNKELSDVILQVQGKELYAHKIVSIGRIVKNSYWILIGDTKY
jgi:hypothetical protein